MVKKTDADRSLELEAEVGDDAAAYKMKDAELSEYLDDLECVLCGELVDALGECHNFNCDAGDGETYEN